MDMNINKIQNANAVKPNFSRSLSLFFFPNNMQTIATIPRIIAIATELMVSEFIMLLFNNNIFNSAWQMYINSFLLN